MLWSDRCWLFCSRSTVIKLLLVLDLYPLTGLLRLQTLCIAYCQRMYFLFLNKALLLMERTLTEIDPHQLQKVVGAGSLVKLDIRGCPIHRIRRWSDFTALYKICRFGWFLVLPESWIFHCWKNPKTDCKKEKGVSTRSNQHVLTAWRTKYDLKSLDERRLLAPQQSIMKPFDPKSILILHIQQEDQRNSPQWGN